MVTYSDLFQFVVMIVSIITLIYTVTKKITAPSQRIRLF